MTKISKLERKKKKKKAKLAKTLPEGVSTADKPALFNATTYDSRGRPRKTDRKLNYKRFKPKKREVKNKKDLAKLTTEWYDYLKYKGFKDIEFYDPKTGAGQDSPFFANDRIAIDIARNYSPEKEFHYSMCRNFLTWAPDSAYENKQVKYCFELYTEGYSYRQIAKKLESKKQFWKPRSYFWVFEHLKPVLAEMKRWNREDKEGLLNPAQTDFFVEDIMAKEPEGKKE